MVKKAILLALLGGLLYGCGDSGSGQQSCKVDSTVPVCSTSTLISYCQSDDGSNDGNMVLSGVEGRTLVCHAGLGHYCEGGLLKKGGYCKDGKISVICRNNRVEEVNDNCASLCDEAQYKMNCDATGKIKYCKDGLVQVMDSPVCNEDIIYHCENSVLKQGSFCLDGKSVYCSSGKVQKEDCTKSQQECVEYSRGEGGLTSNCADKVVDGCGEYTNLGKCGDNDETLTFCSKENKLVTLNCKKSNGKKCLHIEESYGFDCASQCGEKNEYNEFGTCSEDKKILKYCSSKGLEVVDCSEKAGDLVCGFGNWFFDCIKKKDDLTMKPEKPKKPIDI